MARRQDYPSLGETIADFGANVVEFLPSEDPLEIATLRGSQIQSTVAYMGGDEAIFRQLIAMRPDLFNLNNPFAFARFVNSNQSDG